MSQSHVVGSLAPPSASSTASTATQIAQAVPTPSASIDHAPLHTESASSEPASSPMTQSAAGKALGGVDLHGQPRDNLLTRIQDYVEELVENGLPSERLLQQQRDQFCPREPERLKAALPTYSADGKLYLFPQLLLRLNALSPIKEAVDEVLRRDAAQAPHMLMAVAASGMGKTHLGYEAGMELAYCIMIRVALFAPHQKLQFSAPWRLLIQHMEAYLPTSGLDKLDGLERETIAANCSTLMEVLVLCYLDVTAKALNFAKDALEVKDVRKLMKLCLRFHRNGRSEELVADKFKEVCTQYGTTELRGDKQTLLVSPDFVESFRDEAKKGMQSLPRLNSALSSILCFDEVGALVEKVVGIFISNRAKTVPRAPIDPVFSRGAFYGLVGVAGNISRKFAEGQSGVGRCLSYMTGTTFSMVTESDELSTARRVSRTVSPTELLEPSSMLEIIKSFFSIPKDILDSSEFTDALTRCSGRPLLFIECVFNALVGLLPEQLTLQSLLLEINHEADDQVGLHFNKLMDLLKNPLAVSPHTTGLVFLPALLRSECFHQGIITIPSSNAFSEQMLSSGVCCFPPLPNEQKTPVCYDLNKEPVTLAALTRVREKSLNGNILSALAPAAIPISDSEKGLKMEKILAYHLALKNQRAGCTPHSQVTLENLLSEFKPERSTSCIAVLDDLTTSANRAISCESVVFQLGKDKNFCPLELFDNETVHQRLDPTCAKGITSDASGYNMDIILYDLPDACGVDLAFLCEDRSNRVRLVGIQCKNSQTATVMDSLLTLPAGAQYLEEGDRKAMFRDAPLKEKKKISNPYLAFIGFCKNHPLLSQDWVRVAFVANAIIAKPVLDRSHLSPYDPESPWANNTGAPARMAQSPFVLLTFDPPNHSWLPTVLHGHVVQKQKRELRTPEDEAYWFAFNPSEVFRKMAASTGLAEAIGKLDADIRDFIMSHQPASSSTSATTATAQSDTLGALTVLKDGETQPAKCKSDR